LVNDYSQYGQENMHINQSINQYALSIW